MVAALDDMVVRGLISRNKESWQLGVAPEGIDLQVPKSLHQMIEAQIERLSAEEKRVLEAASLESIGHSRFGVAARRVNRRRARSSN
jgi:predicted ATPase